MNKIILGILFLTIMLPKLAYSQTDTLTLEQCVGLALKNNPQIKIAEGNYGVNAANLKLTRSAIFPQLMFQSSWSNNEGTTFLGPTARTSDYQSFAAGFQLQQQIFDFGKTYYRISAYTDLKDASKQDLISAKQDLILATNIAFFNYLEAIRMDSVYSETLTQASEHLSQAEAFYKAGTHPQYDVLTAKTDVANAKVNLIAANNNVRLSKIQLENILNSKLPDDFRLKDILEVNQDSINYSFAYQTALSNRPEIISDKYKISASQSLLTSAWTANLPTINATAGYNWRSYTIDQQYLYSWNVGVTFSLPIFQGFALDAGIEQAKANMETAQATSDATIQAVNLDVQQQYSNLEQAKEQIDATKTFVRQAQETLKLAEARYREGVGSPIEITDARVTMANASASYIQSLYSYQVTFARLKRAMGVLK